MPPRVVVLAIVAFWLMMTSVLVQKKIVPRWRAEAAPAYTIEVTDEAGSPQVEWHVFHGDKQIGRAVTQIRRQPDRTFEMTQRFRFDGFKLPVFVFQFDISKLDTIYRVNREGQLLGLSVSGAALLTRNGDASPLELTAELSGDVADGILEPKLKALGQSVDVGLGAIKVDEHGSILNPMHLLHRLPGLRAGQRWKVPLLDPLKMFSAKNIMGQSLSMLPQTPTYLEAEVVADRTTWNRGAVDCLRVTYREPGRDEIARTWVRRSDGLVLAQEAKHQGYDLSIRRVPEPGGPP